MKFVAVLVCDPDRLAPDSLLAGRALGGHVMDQLQQLAPSLDFALEADRPGGDLGRWMRWNGLGVIKGGRQGELPEGADAVIRVSAHAPFLPMVEIAVAVALVRARQFAVVRVTAPRFPLGFAAEVSRRDAGAGSVLEIPASDAFQTSEVPVDMSSLEDGKAAERILLALPRSLARSRPDEILHALKGGGRGPWKGKSGPLLIAEIGGNHEGDFEAAKRMTELAIGSGADCVKFQIYQASSLVSPVESPDRYKHFQRFELTRDQHIHLAEMCREAGTIYLSSVWDMELLEWIDPYLDFYKVGSGDLTALPILRDLARRGKPILLSTGLSNLDDIHQAVNAIRQVDSKYAKPDHLCIMQCTSMYPIPDDFAHLRVMDIFSEVFGAAVGYSDHTVGARALVVATAMGADVLEFHFTDNREGKSFRDHKVSLTAEEVKALREELAATCKLRGDRLKLPQAVELAEGHEISFRRGVYPARDVKAGDVLSAVDLTILRPAHGTDARDFDRVVGARALRDLSAFAAMREGADFSVAD